MEGKGKIKKVIFSKRLRSIFMKIIYVVNINKTNFQNKYIFFFTKIGIRIFFDF